MNEATERRIPNKAFDLEYSTQRKKEMLYLKDHGFNYTFVKHTADYNIPTYKYTKTPELFRAVADFYEQQKREKAFANASGLVEIAKEFSIIDERDIKYDRGERS